MPMIRRMLGMLCLLSAAVLPSHAADRASELLAGLAARFRAMKSYEAEFAVTADDHRVTGRYVVAGDRYYIAVGDAEVYADAALRREIDNVRREITLVGIDAEDRSILANPARAFDLLDDDYRATLLCEEGGTAVVRLEPRAGKSTPTGAVTVTLDVASGLPRSIAYDYDGAVLTVEVVRIEPGAGLPLFEADRYAGYETIDFR